MVFLYIDIVDRGERHDELLKEVNCVDTEYTKCSISSEKFPELPKRVQLAHWPHRSIVDGRSPVHDRIPFGELHHT